MRGKYTPMFEEKYDTLCLIPNKDDVKEININYNIVRYITYSGKYEPILNFEKLLFRKDELYRRSRHDIPKCIEDYKNLKSLVIKNNIFMDKLENLNLSNLEILDVSSTNVKKLENLGKLSSLKELIVRNSSIEKIEGLNALFELEKLDLSRNKIKKIDGLENLMSLKRLDLNDNEIEKMEGLYNLFGLEDLLLSDNKIKKIEKIGELRNLRNIALENNEVRELSGIEENKRLTSLSVGGKSLVEIPKFPRIDYKTTITINFGKIKERQFCPKVMAYNQESENCLVFYGDFLVGNEPDSKRVMVSKWIDEWNENVELM